MRTLANSISSSGCGRYPPGAVEQVECKGSARESAPNAPDPALTHRQPAPDAAGYGALLAFIPAVLDGLQRQLAQAMLVGPLTLNGFIAGQSFRSAPSAGQGAAPTGNVPR
jgi:hypothetical protein